MKEELKGVGWELVVILFLGLLMGIGLALLYGLVWVVGKLYPLAQALASLGTVLLVLMLLPSAFFKRSRNICGKGVVLVSYLWGLSLWMSALLLLYELWGLVGAFFGVILLPFGAVPLACIALLFHGEFALIGLIVLSVILIFAVRSLGHWIISKGVPPQLSCDYYDYQ